MKKVLAGCFGIILLSGICTAAEKPEIKNDMDRINYSVGYQIGGDFKRQGVEPSPEMLVQGVRDAVNDVNPLLPPEQMNAVLVKLKKKIVADQRQEGRKADAAFLAANAKKEGVVVLPSGVQYKVIKEGAGKQPRLQDSVTISYRISRVDGLEPIAGYPESGPKIYPLQKALPGLQEVLLMMKEGALWQVALPPGPATGGRSEAMENAGVLVYELELLSVQSGG